ncbi:response regulator transcription factor [Flindersiella endophytica]
MAEAGDHEAPTHYVLVVDDDPTVAEVVLAYLKKAGNVVQHAADGETALAMIAQRRPDLLVLDLMLPGVDGLEVCRRLRATDEGRDLPIVMLTALGGEADRVLGLELGADDYVTKPFSPRELVLRVRSVLRRHGGTGTGAAQPWASATEPRTLTDGDLALDLAAHQATRGGKQLALTVREFDLLAFLLGHPGQAFTREQLLEKVWGWTFGDQSTVTVHVRRLREKVEPDPGEPRRLVTVWGVGYRWAPAGEEPAT